MDVADAVETETVAPAAPALSATSRQFVRSKSVLV